MSLVREDLDALSKSTTLRSHSAQGLSDNLSPSANIPLPPRLWITDIEDESSDDMSSVRDDESFPVERSRVRSRYRHHKRAASNSIPIGIFWDIENCQVPRGCSAIDVVAAIRAKFLVGRREADFVVVCDVRKEMPNRLQELNDSQVSLIHVCGTQKNAADEKLRQCMRRFGELHPAPASLLLISGDINFAADLSDFRHRKNMEVILVHKQNTSTALITCASSHFCYNELTAHLPRNPKISQTEEDEPTCEMEVVNLPVDQPPERVSRRLRRLADNCGGKVLRVTASTAMMKFPTPDHASRALKRMDGEDVFGRKIGTRYVRTTFQPTYSSDEGYSTAPPNPPPVSMPPPPPQFAMSSQVSQISLDRERTAANEWALALQQLPAPAPAPMEFCPPPAPKPRKIRGRHGSASLDQSGCSSSNCSGDDSRRDLSLSRAVSPWNSSGSFSEQSETEENIAELTVANLPSYDTKLLQEMLIKLFNHYVPVMRVSVWSGGEGPIATVVLRSEGDARLAIARVHKRRLDNQWAGRRLDLSLGRPSPAPNLDVLRARLRAILLEQKSHAMPLVRLRDAYASRHCCALTTADIAKVRDTVVIHDGFGRMVQLVDFSPVTSVEMEEAPWKCHIHALLNTGQEDGSRILLPVFMEISVLTKNICMLLDSHNGVLPLLSFVECYEAMFPPLMADSRHGVTLELLLRSISSVVVRDSPSRHLTWADPGTLPLPFDQVNPRTRGRTAPSLEPMLALLEKELIDLLKVQPKCCIQFSKLIPTFHHHFGRQCRVADYGFTKLPDLLAALSKSIVVLGSGSYRVITISAAAQRRRWTSDLLKILNAQPGHVIYAHRLPQIYQATMTRPFSPVDYGVCTVEDLLERTIPGSVVFGADGAISLPTQSPRQEDYSRILQFATQAVDLLCYTPNFQMEFSRFVPSFHTHYGTQLRVSHYGCAKLIDLFDQLPDLMTVQTDPSGERILKLVPKMASTLMGRRLKTLTPVPLAALPARYASQYGAPPQPDMMEVTTLEELVLAAGARIEWGIVYSATDTANWVNMALTACSVLSADRSVSRGSTEEYFVAAFTQLRGLEPEVKKLESSGVIEVSDRFVRLSALWRTVWRVVIILTERRLPIPAMEVFLEYTKRYGPSFPNAELGLEAVVEFLQEHDAIFKTVPSVEGAMWQLCEGVCPPPLREVAKRHFASEDYSMYDTPPGQKGSRVFDSPLRNIWSSPPACALPLPTALLNEEKRRTRLAAQFDAV
ncbi:unnamed protein product [Leptosia nina]|uniref:Meiosis regulator and mRNA stability factor 1 n=1 Tax=Leptosia nina TaxID=320188 RepID=A0AAV1JEX7_9NEOP